MAKTLNQFLEGYLKVKNPDEQKFVDKHVVAKHSDRNGNGDEVFKGSKVKMDDRRKTRHGYNPGEDEKVYEELKSSQHKIDANKNGKVDAHDFHLLRKKKKVAEEAEELDELSTEKLLAYRKKAREADTNKHHVYADEADKKIKKKTGVYNPNLLQRAKAKLRNEEAEELDELSTDTLRNYRAKAKDDAYDAADVDDERRLRKRSMGSWDAGKKILKRGDALRKEEAEELEELSKSTMGAYTKKAAADFSARKPKMGYDGQLKKMQNRTVGVNRALKKMYGEEAEQIDELSKKTMGSYIKKASGAEQPKNVMSPKNVPLTKIAAYQGDSETGYFGKRFNQHTYDKAERLRKNRETGIKRATDKLTKEEVEAIEEKLNMDTASMGTVVKDFQKSDAPQFKGKSQDKRRAMAIAAKLTAERGGKPLRKEEKLADLLGDLTETHRRTMLFVFDKLNEGNQKKFLEACETPEGVESMLDFSISHRGE